MSWAKRLARVFLGGRSREKGANGPRGRRVAVEALEDRRLLSVDFGVTAVDTGGVTWPIKPVVFEDAIYFRGHDATHGDELWKMDDSENVSLVADIRAGNQGANPWELTVLGDRLYFRADDGIHGSELWTVDSSGAVSLFSDLCPGPMSSSPSDLTVYDGQLFFHAWYGDPGLGLWRVDSSGSVTLVNDYSDATLSDVDLDLKAALGSLYYNDPSGNYWRMDSTGKETDPYHVADPEVFRFKETFFRLDDGDQFDAASLWEIDESGSDRLVKRLGGRGDSVEQLVWPAHVATDAIYIHMAEFSASYDEFDSLWSVDSAGNLDVVLDYGLAEIASHDIGMQTESWEDWLFFDDKYMGLHAIGSTGHVIVEGGSVITVPRNMVRFGDHGYFMTTVRATSESQIWRIDAPGHDFGDAPDEYGTTRLADGARHLALGPMLGEMRDVESDGVHSSDASGDDVRGSDDEDGVTFASTTFVTSADVNVQNAPDGAKLDAWIDFNGDGSFDGPGEQIFDSLDVVEGANPLSFVVPEGAIVGDTYARFRLSSAGGLAPTGSAADGEVEDYLVSIIPADTPYSLLSETVDVGHGLLDGEASADIDGDYAIVGSRIYRRVGDDWHQMQELSEGGAFSSISGTRAVVAEGTEVHIYELVDRVWQLQGEWILPSGTMSDVEIDGETIAVLSHWRDYSYEGPAFGYVDLLEMTGEGWEAVHRFDHRHVDSIDFKNGTLGVAKSGYYTYDGAMDQDGSLHAGFVSLHRKVDGEWKRSTFSAEVHWASTIWEDDYDDGFGTGVAVDGDRAIGMGDEYSLDLRWDESTGRWNEAAKTDDFLSGAVVAIDGDFVVEGIERQLTILGPSDVRYASVDSELGFVATDEGSVLAGGRDGIHWYDLNSTNQTEEFQVAVKEGGEITVSSSGETTPRIDVYDPSGQLVASDWSFLTCVASSMGVYTVKTTAQTDQWVSYDVSILSEVPASTGPLVADYLEMVYALPPERANLLPLEAARDGYLTVVGRELNSTDAFGFVLLDEDRKVLEPPSPTTAQGAGAWSYEQRLDYLATGGESFYLMVLGDGSQVDLRVCNLVRQTGDTVDVFDTDGVDAYLFSVSDTFNVTANGVDYRFDDATSFTFHSEAGDDTIEMVDSDGDDTLTVSPSQMVLSGTTSGGTAFSATADGFRYAHGYAKAGGNDRAQFVGSAQADRVKAYEQLVKAMGGSYYARAKFFESVEVDLGVGVDSAVVVGSGGADVVWAMKDETRVAHDVDLAAGARLAFGSMAYDVTIVGAERVVARARGGDDWVELHDSALNDVLIAKPHKVEMMNGPREGVQRAAEYRISARGYQNVSAIADQGGDADVAKLYDTGEEGVDLWAAAYVDGETWSTMASPSRLLYEVLAFEQVGGYGFNGGLGEGHGTNRPEHGDDVDFVFKYGYWEGDEEPGPRDPRTERGR